MTRTMYLGCFQGNYSNLDLVILMGSFQLSDSVKYQHEQSVRAKENCLIFNSFFLNSECEELCALFSSMW